MKKLKLATQREKALKALKLKRASPTETAKPETPTANEGMTPNPNNNTVPSGALDHAG